MPASRAYLTVHLCYRALEPQMRISPPFSLMLMEYSSLDDGHKGRVTHMSLE